MSLLDIVLDRRSEPKEEKPYSSSDIDGKGCDMQPPVYWQEPVLQKEDVFSETKEERKPRTKHDQTIPKVGTLPTYRSYTNNQF